MSVPSTRPRRLAAMALIAVVAMVSPVVTSVGLSAAHADGTAVTVTGPSPAWDEINGHSLSNLPTATVSQTTDLVDQTVQVSWSNFSPSTDNPYDPTTPRPGIYYGGPGTDLYPVWVLECRGTDPADDLLTATPSCYLTSSGRTDGPGGLGNSIYAVTNPDGTAQVSFHVENAQTNSVLGCDATHACSILVLPAFGGRQDPNSTINCADHTQDYPTKANGYQNDPTTLASDNMFGAACSWANRLVVPLSFAATPSNCPNTAASFSAAGSPMLSRALQQWQAGWCHGSSALSFNYNSTSNEYEARSSFLNGGQALTSSTDVALTTQPGDGGRKHTYAPIANTDIAIAFVIDDPKTGRVIPDLTLNPRLVAKLLTQSYSLQFACTSGGDTTKQSNTCDPAIKGNPSSIFTDPEFLALNPQITPADYSAQNLAVGEFLPTVVSGNSDLTWALTSWVASDADARAFLAGQDDSWGMHVNTYYRGVEYPTSQLQELDPGFVDRVAPAGNGTMQNAWQPVNGLDTVGQLLVGNSTSSLSNVQSQCSAPPCSFPRVIDQLGARALFAVLDQGTASAYAFPTAKLVNAAGRAVGPTTDGVSAGLSSMTTNADGITQSPNFASTNASAYPLSVVDYAMLPTCGVSASSATGIQNFLGRVQGSQTYGLDPGTIAPGYLALTSHQLGQLTAASSAVSSTPCAPGATTHSGTSAPARPSGHATPGSSATSGPGFGPTPRVSSAPGLNRAAAGRASRTSTAGGPANPSSSSGVDAAPGASPSQQAVSFGYKPSSGATALRYVLPGLLALGALLLLGGPGVYFALTTGAAGFVTSRARRWYRSVRG